MRGIPFADLHPATTGLIDQPEHLLATSVGQALRLPNRLQNNDRCAKHLLIQSPLSPMNKSKPMRI
jgi:hypothetical protein